MDSELKARLREAFGDSSSDSDGESELLHIDNSTDETLSIIRPRPVDDPHLIWQPVTGINGLWICRDFLSLSQQSSLLSALEREGYFAGGSHNQAMRFGDLPSWAIELSLYIRENVSSCSHMPVSADHSSIDDSGDNFLFPPELLGREPLFNQLIVNIYQPGEGIRAHVDLMRFEDGIAIVSLDSSCVMRFSPAEAESSDHLEEPSKETKSIPVLLTPGSLILMWGEARHLWKHEINRNPGFQQWDGKDIDQKRRTSITLRKLCQTD